MGMTGGVPAFFETGIGGADCALAAGQLMAPPGKWLRRQRISALGGAAEPHL